MGPSSTSCAVNEPFLESFRTPTLVSTLLADNLPFAAACRKLADEPFGQPWRVMLFGDPLYRVRPVRPAAGRLQEWSEVITWASYPARSPGPRSVLQTRAFWGGP